MARQFGIVTDMSNTLSAGILINSITFDESTETAQARDTTGAVVDIAAYSRSTSISIDGLLDTSEGVELVKAGNKITIGGKDYLIESVSKQESNTDFCTVSISARTSDNATLHIINTDEGN